MSAKLRVYRAQSGELLKEVEVTSKPLRIGREAPADLVLAFPEVSRNHAEVSFNGSQIEIVDLGSANGISQKGQKHQRFNLSNSDEVQIGHLRIVAAIETAFEHTVVMRPETSVSSPGDSTVVVRDPRSAATADPDLFEAHTVVRSRPLPPSQLKPAADAFARSASSVEKESTASTRNGTSKPQESAQPSATHAVLVLLQGLMGSLVDGVLRKLTILPKQAWMGALAVLLGLGAWKFTGMSLQSSDRSPATQQAAITGNDPGEVDFETLRREIETLYRSTR